MLLVYLVRRFSSLDISNLICGIFPLFKRDCSFVCKTYSAAEKAHTNVEDIIVVFMTQDGVVFVTTGAGRDRSLSSCRMSDIR